MDLKTRIIGQIYSWILLPVILFVSCACKKEVPEVITGNLIVLPLPVRIEPQSGSFTIDQKTWIQTDSFDKASFDPIKVFNSVFKTKSGYSIPLQKTSIKKNVEEHVILIIHSHEHKVAESYRLRVSPTGIIINAYDEAGVFYALQTLRQIMRLDAIPDVTDAQRQWVVPAVDIIDEPSFKYRGMHLDVSRHFFPVEFVKKYIDLLAYYKMNRFHWHLTDDQGWRIEIKKYPKLNEVAAWRDQTLIGKAGNASPKFDGQRYGGFYTQEEIKAVVAYAKDRGVTIIPEIEMPGHAVAALAAYPQFGCTNNDTLKVAQKWGVFNDIFCPTEETFSFLQDILDEVMELFPSTYIHIGGDEVPKLRWKQSAYCQQLMRTEGLKNEAELQSYFIQRIEKYLNSNGRQIIGWDEILEGGIAPHATIMSWRGINGGISAARSGHDAIMTPGAYCYLDHYQDDPAKEPLAIGGLTKLDKVYSYNPIPDSLTQEEAKHILGAQGNLWTEYLTTPEAIEYMAYPRAIALAEVLWTPASRKNFKDFLQRLTQHTDRLDGMNVHYATHFREYSR